MSEFEGKIVREKRFDRLVQLFWENLPGEIDREVLENSLRHCAGTLMTKELLFATCWRMAGNNTRLRHGCAVPPWHVQKLPERVALHITACRPERNIKGTLGGLYEFRVVGGTSCPMIVQKWWSFKQASWFATDGFGFSKKLFGRTEPTYPFSDLAQLVNLRLYGLVEPELCGKEPMFSEPTWPASVKDWNRSVLKLRFRANTNEQCPRRFPLQLACHHCPVGFFNCLAGCHRHDWQEKECKECGRKDAIFDPEIREPMCIDCYNKKAIKREH